MGLVVDRGARCREALLLDHLDRGTSGLVTDGDSNIEEGMVDYIGCL